MFRELAMNTEKDHIIYYGAAGHGRGLVDAMSSFGVKSPLRKEIINNDYYYWSSSSDLVDLFKSKSMGDRMHYSSITREEIESQNKPEELKLKNSTKMHCIVFHHDVSVEMQRDICECDECFDGNLSRCLYKESGTEFLCDKSVFEDDVEDEDTLNEDEETIDVIEAVVPGSFIALSTPVEVTEFLSV